VFRSFDEDVMAGSKYTKADIVDSVYQKTGMNRKEIRTVIDLFLDEIKDALIKRMAIELRGFGTFEIRIRKGRQKARNPRTGKTVTVNSHGIAAFRPGWELKHDVWNLGDAEAFFEADGDAPADEGGVFADSVADSAGGLDGGMTYADDTTGSDT
jgi:integration host factor subunit beta